MSSDPKQDAPPEQDFASMLADYDAPAKAARLQPGSGCRARWCTSARTTSSWP